MRSWGHVFTLLLPAPVAIIATTGHVRRTSFLADVQLVRKCFSNGTEALPGGRHLRVLSVERSTANATETLALVHFDVAPTVYIRTDRRCPQARSFDICVPLNRNGACVLTCTLVMVLVLTIGGISAQVHISSPVSGGTVCYKDQFEVTCWYPEAAIQGRYLVPSPGWKVNGSVLTLDEIAYRDERINSTATKLIVTITGSFSVNTVVAYSCFLLLADTRLDDESTQQVHITIMATPNPPIIATVNSLNTSISLSWTHDRTCFESVPVKYHILVNTDTHNQPVITDRLMAEVNVGIVFGGNYTVSVMAKADGTQRSEPHSESITAGFPTTRNQAPHQCFDREFKLTCHHEYETTSPHVWYVNRIPVEHGSQFAINNADRSITLLDVNQSSYTNKETFFQCCVEWTSGPQVCGVHYIFDPLEQPKAPTVTIIRVEQTSISLSWELSKTCFESVNFTITISWMPASGEGQATNVSGSSYTITDLIPDVIYNITLVAIGNGVRSDSISISAATLASVKVTVVAIVGIALAALAVVAVAVITPVAVAVAVIARRFKSNSGNYV